MIENSIQGIVSSYRLYLIFSDSGELLKRKWYHYHLSALEAQSMKLGKDRVNVYNIKKFKLGKSTPGRKYYITLMYCYDRKNQIRHLSRFVEGVYLSNKEVVDVMRQKNIRSYNKSGKMRLLKFSLEECVPEVKFEV